MVVRVNRVVAGRCISALGQADTAEDAEDRARQRLAQRSPATAPVSPQAPSPVASPPSQPVRLPASPPEAPPTEPPEASADPTDPTNPTNPTDPTGPAEPTQTIWMRARHQLPDGWSQHAAGLAFASDYSLIDTALIAHGMVLFDPALQPASLDHAMWFHRPCRIDEWLLYVQDSPSTSGGRGMCHGRIFTQDGRLVASVAQEGLIRLRSR